MSLGVLGAILLVVLVWLCWRDRRGMAISVVAVVLGVIIAGSGGPLSIAAHGLVDGARTGLTSLGQLVSGGR